MSRKDVIKPPRDVKDAELLTDFCNKASRWLKWLHTPEDWTAPTLLNSWANGSSNPAGYYKHDHRVYLRGVIDSGTPGAASVAFTLPANYRPTNTEITVSICSGPAIAQINIEADGDVVVVAGSTTWTSLDGVSFRVS